MTLELAVVGNAMWRLSTVFVGTLSAVQQQTKHGNPPVRYQTRPIQDTTGGGTTVSEAYGPDVVNSYHSGNDVDISADIIGLYH